MGLKDFESNVNTHDPLLLIYKTKTFLFQQQQLKQLRLLLYQHQYLNQVRSKNIETTQTMETQLHADVKNHIIRSKYVVQILLWHQLSNTTACNRNFLCKMKPNYFCRNFGSSPFVSVLSNLIYFIFLVHFEEKTTLF